MIRGITSATDLVYHYTSADTALHHILRNRTLKLAAYGTTNDPKETKSWQFNLGTNEDRDLGAYPFKETSKRFSSALKEYSKVACFSMDTSPLSGDHMRDILHRGYAKPRMWAQYGDKHRGVCLVFKRDALLSVIRQTAGAGLVMSGEVHYQNAPLLQDLSPGAFTIDIDLYESLGPVAYARSHVQVHHRTLFFEKLLDWRDESEWRVVLQSESAGDQFVPYGAALVGVMHGAEIDEGLSRSIAEMTDDREVEHMGLTWKNSSPWYHYEAMRWSATDRASPWGMAQRTRVA